MNTDRRGSGIPLSDPFFSVFDRTLGENYGALLSKI
jgi:hypothetical protein